MKDLIVILGATASGKTEVAVRVAQRIETEVVSADARQMYRGFRIATAAPDEETMLQVPHHFIGSEDPCNPLSAGSYAEKCCALLQDLFLKYDQLVMVGGSGLYVQAVCAGIATSVEVPQEVRAKWRRVAEAGAIDELRAFVALHAPTYYAEMDASNPRRLARAAELIESHGASLEQLRASEPPQRSFRAHKLGLSLPRPILHKRIEERCAYMLRLGLWDEARSLYQRHAPHQLPPTIGHREAFAHFEGKCSQKEAEERMVINSKQYAKRQLTWLRREKDIKWVPATDLRAIDAAIDQIIDR